MKLLECACFEWVLNFTGVWNDLMQLVYAGCLSYTMMRTAKSGGASQYTSFQYHSLACLGSLHNCRMKR